MAATARAGISQSQALRHRHEHQNITTFNPDPECDPSVDSIKSFASINPDILRGKQPTPSSGSQSPIEPASPTQLDDSGALDPKQSGSITPNDNNGAAGVYGPSRFGIDQTTSENVTKDGSRRPTSGFAPNSGSSVSYLSHSRPIHVQKESSLLSRHLRTSIAQLNPAPASSSGSDDLSPIKPTLNTYASPTNSSSTLNVQTKDQSPVAQPRLAFTGFKHLLMMLLFVCGLRLFAFDAQQFGFWDALSNAGLNGHDIRSGIMLAAIDLLYLPLSLAIERLASYIALGNPTLRKKLGDSLVSRLLQLAMMTQAFNALACLVGGTWFVYNYIWHPLVGTLGEAVTIVTFLKLVSFALTNRDLRDTVVGGYPQPELYSSCPYPSNLTLQNILYFWSAPTLVYQPVYPRTSRIRWISVVSLLAEIFTGITCNWFLAMQMASRILKHVVVDYQQRNWGNLFDDYLSLATVNICIWLLGFFIVFQSSLNCIAEVTRFADREFYQDWWNAGCVGTFWRDWNKPVSNFFRRHVYTPLRKRGWSTYLASNVVFLISAILHELLFGAPTRNFNGVAFFCMIGQSPLIMVTAPLEKMRGRGTTIGNCMFWISILFGMPTAIVIYYLAWHIRQTASE